MNRMDAELDILNLELRVRILETTVKALRQVFNEMLQLQKESSKELSGIIADCKAAEETNQKRAEEHLRQEEERFVKGIRELKDAIKQDVIAEILQAHNNSQYPNDGEVDMMLFSRAEQEGSVPDDGNVI